MFPLLYNLTFIEKFYIESALPVDLQSFLYKEGRQNIL